MQQTHHETLDLQFPAASRSRRRKFYLFFSRLSFSCQGLARGDYGQRTSISPCPNPLAPCCILILHFSAYSSIPIITIIISLFIFLLLFPILLFLFIFLFLLLLLLPFFFYFPPHFPLVSYSLYSPPTPPSLSLVLRPSIRPLSTPQSSPFPLSLPNSLPTSLLLSLLFSFLFLPHPSALASLGAVRRPIHP